MEILHREGAAGRQICAHLSPREADGVNPHSGGLITQEPSSPPSSAGDAAAIGGARECMPRQSMSTHPVIFGFDFGSFLPGVAQAFWDTQSRNELAGFFEPIAGKYTGAPSTLAQVLERIHLCIA